MSFCPTSPSPATARAVDRRAVHRTLLTAATWLALSAGLATSAQAGVATAAYNRVPSGDPFFTFSTYRTLQDAAGRFTLAIDDDANNHSTSNGLSCPQDPNYACSGSNGGTIPGSPNNLTTAFSTSSFAAGPIGNPPSTADAAARASLGAGTLGASALSNGLNSQAFARLDDRLNFVIAGANANTQTQIGISFVLDGSLDPRGGVAQVGTNLRLGGGSAALFYQLTPTLNSSLVSSQIATGWDSYSWSGIDPTHTVFTGFLTVQGTSALLDISHSMSVEGIGGGWSNYGSTSHLALILPSNVTYTSDSGVFLAENNSGGGGTGGGNPVPEPSTWSLLAAVVLGSRLLRRPR